MTPTTMTTNDAAGRAGVLVEALPYIRRFADQIVVVDKGRIAETGTHSALLGRGGLYARLVSRQLASAYAPAAS